jgi:hypothetical protein
VFFRPAIVEFIRPDAFYAELVSQFRHGSIPLTLRRGVRHHQTYITAAVMQRLQTTDTPVTIAQEYYFH